MVYCMKLKLSELWLYLIIGLLPIYRWRFEVWNIPSTVLEVLIVAGLFIVLIQYRGKLYLGRWKYSMIVFAIIGVTAIIASAQTLAALGLYKAYVLEPVLVGIMILTIKPKFNHVLCVLSGAVGYVGIAAVVQYFTGYGIPEPWNIPGSEYRITSVFEYPNAVGLFCAPIVAMLVAHVIATAQYRAVFVTAIVLGLVSIMLSHSAGAVIAVTAATVISLYLLDWKKIAVSFVFICSICILIVPLFRETVLFQDNSGQVRLALWQGTAHLLQYHPWFGAGLAGFPKMYEQYKLARHTELLLYPHNIFLDFWVELGLAGLVWFIATFYQIGKQAIIKKQYTQLAGMIAIIVYGLVDVPYFKNDLAVLFWVILTL